ncbi:hypothetical protein [Streptomyces sp. G-G2]|uniref:hypothetical protein n=1 Tax=Streptomyces sp. G-G2 TaxID=3046201 RepID=UPI0024B9BF4F|nr:hypothetical protein [Streptomyces sp. G-G2]MDJ0386009.1 hypothetical protein [Streptomyces sp. G-G2]
MSAMTGFGQQTESWPTVVDITALGLRVRGLPVISASQGMMKSWAHDLEGLAEDFEEIFSGTQYAEVGSDLHQLGDGSAELRLRPWSGAQAWHLDLFLAGWSNHPYDGVPPERRVEVAAYTDQVAGLCDGRLRENDLRTAAANGGAAAVDRLVREQVERLDQRHGALDVLHGSLLDDDLRLPHWALNFMLHEIETLHGDREWLAAAVLTYHHGTAGNRPENVFGGIGFVFTHGSIDLARGNRAQTAGGWAGLMRAMAHEHNSDEATATQPAVS